MAAQELTTEWDRTRVKGIRQATWVGLRVNIVLCLFKIVAGFYGNSRAVVADGVHSLADLVTDIAVLVGVRLQVEAVDEQALYAHRRLEAMVSIFIGAVLAVAGIGIAYNALSNIGRQESGPVGSILALCAALVSIVSKELLYRWTRKKGEELQSDVVEANAWDHRSDAVSSVPTAVAVAVAMWVPGCGFADLLGAAAVSIFILYAAWRICSRAVHTLVDGGSDPAARGKIREFTLRLPDVRAVRSLRTRHVGQGLQVNMRVSVDAALVAGQAEAIARSIENALYTTEAGKFIGVEVFEVLVHIVPWAPVHADEMK